MQKPSDSQSSDSQWTILDLIKWTTTYFDSHQIDCPRLTVELLLAHVLGIERIDLYLRFDQPLSADELAHFKQLIKRRLNREPLAYILGRRDFWEMTVAVDQNVLIPRPETEFLVEAALNLIPESSNARRMRILELGTGSGAIILSLAAGRPGHLFYASDMDFNALKVARKNAGANQLAGHVGFFAANWFAPIQATAEFDLIVSNPPYIPANDIAGLAPEIYNYEPELALDGGADGLTEIRHIIESAPPHLSEGGRLLIEIGNGQSVAVQALIEAAQGLQLIRIIQDYGGYNRVVAAEKL